MLYVFIIKKTHVPVPLLCPTSTLRSSVLFFHVSPLCESLTHSSTSFFPSFLPSLPHILPYRPHLRLYCYCFLFLSPSFLPLHHISPLLHSFPSPRRSPIPLCVALVCVIASFLPTAHPLLRKWEQGEQRGECHAGPREQGLNEATLNEFTAFHRAAPFPCCGPAPRPLSHWAPHHLCWGISDTCLSDTSVISCHYCGK